LQIEQLAVGNYQGVLEQINGELGFPVEHIETVPASPTGQGTATSP
jgi:hypothetical protein